VGPAVLGTTSVAVDDPDDFPRTRREVARVVEECAAMCPALADAAVGRTYWGVRPLYAPDEADRDDARAISRDFALLDHESAGAAGLVTVVGGKLTTYRLMAERAGDLVCDAVGIDRPSRTAEKPLPEPVDGSGSAAPSFDLSVPEPLSQLHHSGAGGQAPRRE
jgi:glycerol-3-phosphate dehydrogenase